MKYFTIFLLIIFYGCSAQKVSNKILPKITTDLKRMELKGPVRTHFFAYTYVKPGLNNYLDQYVKLKNYVKGAGAGYVEFNEQGMVKFLRSRFYDSINQKIDRSELDCYEYSNKDIALKSKYKPLNLEDNEDLVKLNKVVWWHCTKVSNETEDDGILFVYKYKFDNENKIIEELEYSPYHEQIDSEPSIEDLFAKTVYKYDKSNKLVEKIILAGENRIGEQYFIMDATFGLGSDIKVLYEYDNNGKLTKKTAKKDGKVYAEEVYSYNPEKQFIESVKKYVYGISGYDFSKMIITYNEYGDMIQFEYDVDEIMISSGLSKYRYYEYEYDKHNNWIKCKMYLQGDRNEPTIIAERKIEYYND